MPLHLVDFSRRLPGSERGTLCLRTWYDAVRTAGNSHRLANTQHTRRCRWWIGRHDSPTTAHRFCVKMQGNTPLGFTPTNTRSFSALEVKVSCVVRPTRSAVQLHPLSVDRLLDYTQFWYFGICCMSCRVSKPAGLESCTTNVPGNRLSTFVDGQLINGGAHMSLSLIHI